MKMLTLLGIFIFGVSAHAINGRTTYQAKIIKPDGYPLEASSVNFRFTILDPAASCVLYVEDYAAVNMSGTSGLISFALGAGTRTYPVSSTTFASVFDNSTVSFPCQSPGIYNPTLTDARKIVMQFQDSSGWQTLPAMAINAVPYAMYAGKSENATQLNGKADTAFVENATLAALNCNAATHAITFNGVSFSCIPVGSGSSGVTSVTTSGTVLSTGGTASAPVISITAATMSQDGYLTSLDYAEFKAKLAASSTQIINTLGYAPVSSSAVATQINNSNLSGDVSGTISSNSVISVGGKTSSQISTSVDDTLAATASATADTIVKRNSSGNFTANDIYANAAKINYVDIYKPSTSFNIRLQAPTSLSTNYVLNLPTTSGTTGQVLSTDGAGNLSWINSSTGSVVSVSATAPLASTGGSNPTISITQATSSTDGYLSSTDFNTFNNKQAATSAAIIATLGYTPADNAASGTYAQKANNLSDLASVATARTNLGLGTFATASSIDLGSASATGIIAEARLQTQSNVTSGTQYTKVTVDGKGRVTSGAQLSSSDVTTALGYTPSNAASAGITTLNGSSSATQIFAIGTSGNSPAFNTAAGTHTLNIPLANTGSVTAGLLSNTDYTTFNNKQNATSAAIIATLGYTPADNAASGTYLVKASNLSDLANVATARTNLGLGVFATASSIDLGSVSATGTLAIARLPSFSGDATIAAASNTIVFSNSGVTAGTYTKVIVDVKGRVTSSSALASSDVTTALGYTPANSASGVTSLNGSVSQTQTFATTNTGTGFGVTTANGVHTFAIPLAASSSVVGGLLSNTDYTTFNNKQNATSAAIIATLGYTPANATSATQWTTNGSNIYYNIGNIGVGILNPTAKLELASGTASVAPLKFTSGTLLGSAQSGTMEYDGFNFYLTDSTNTRRTIATGSSAGSIDNASIINSTGNISMVPVGSVIVSSTTASTNSNTGALVVKGGLGVAGNINTAGSLNVSGSSVIDGSLKLSTMTSGSMLFAGANGVVTQDNSSLFWDGANKRLGIGSNSPAQTLSVSGTSYFSGNVGIGTISPGALLHVSSSSQMAERIRLSGQEFYQAGNTDAEGLSLLLGVNRTGNRQLWIGDSAKLTQNASNTILRLSPSSGDISSLATDGVTAKNLLLNANGGNVGIGTTAPTQKLDVMGYIKTSNYGSSAGSAAGLYLYRSQGGSAGSEVAPGNGAGVGFLSFAGYRGDATLGTGALIDVQTPVASGAWTTSSTPGYLRFITTDVGSTAGAVRMTIKENGNVGIGTTNPAEKLDVSGRGRFSTSSAHVFKVTGVGSGYADATDGVATIYSENTAGSGGNILKLGSAFAPNTFVAKDNGNVGIGTTSPLANIHVNGTSGTVITSGLTAQAVITGSVPTDSLTTPRLIIGTGAYFSTAGMSSGELMFTRRQLGGSYSDFGSGIRQYIDSASDARKNGLQLFTSRSGEQNVERLTVTSTGYVGIGTAAPTAKLHLASGTTSLVPLKFTSGSLISSAQPGAMEYDGTDFYITDDNSIRRTIATATTAGTLDNVSVVSSTAGIALWPAAGNSVTVSATTASTNSSTGALVVKGGLGVAGAVNMAGVLNVSGATTVSNVFSAESLFYLGGTGATYSSASSAWAGAERGLSIDNGSSTSWNLAKFKNANGTMMLISGSGNVGIGTSAPVTKLDVNETTAVSSTLGSIRDISAIYGNAGSGNSRLITRQVRTESGGASHESSRFMIQRKVDSTDMGFVAFNGGGTDAGGTSNRGLSLGIGTTDYFTMIQNGNVGVGTSTAASMTAQFNIVGSSAGEVAQYIHNTNPAGYAVLRMNSNWGGYASGTALHTFGPGFGVAGEAYAPSTTTLTGFDSGGLNLHANAGAMRFFTGGYSNVNNQMILTSSGNLGIGVFAPVEKLEVAGNLKVTGDIITSVDSGWALGGAPTLKLTGRSGASLTNATSMYRTATPLALHRDFRASFSYRTSNSTHFGLTFHSQLTDPHDNNYAVIMRSTNIVRVQKRAAAVQTLPIGEIATGLSLTDGNWHTVDVEVVGQNIVVDIDGTNFVNSSLADGTFTNGRVGFINYDGTVEFNNLVVQEISDKTLAKGLIVPEGNVGIGTTTPESKLHVSAGAILLDNNYALKGKADNGTAYDLISVATDGSTRLRGFHGTDIIQGVNGATYLYSSGGGGTTMTLLGSNVGVGTTSPASDAPWSSPALDISGSRGVAILRTTAVNGLSTLRFVGPTAGSDLHVNFDDSNGALKFMPQSGSILGLVQEKTGNVGIGTTAPSEKLHVVGNLRVQGSTDCTLGNGAGGTNCSSDMRLKENIKPIPYALEKIVSLKGVEFDWNAKSISHGRHDIGVIAQDVEKVFPSAVIDDKNTGYKKVDYAVLVAPLIQAIKELYKLVMNRFEVQDRQIASITEKAAKLEAENVALKKYLCSKDPAAPICK